MRTASSARAALLAAAMNLSPLAPVELFRFLNVPAIILTIRQARGRLCREQHRRRSHRPSPWIRHD